MGREGTAAGYVWRGNGLSEFIYIYSGNGGNDCIRCFRSNGRSTERNGYFRDLRSGRGDSRGRWSDQRYYSGNRAAGNVSVGWGVFTVMGVDKGITEGYMGRTFFLVFLGTVTGVGGGLIRDMMAGVPPYIFVRHIYACASIVGAIACVWVYRLWGGVPAMVIGTVVVILIRYLAAHYRWNLPRLRRE